MEKVRFKSGLFGFRRRQVLAYIDGTCAAFQQQLQEQARQHRTEKQALQDRLQQLEGEILSQKERDERQQKKIAEYSHALQAGEAMLAKERETSYFLRQDKEQLSAVKAQQEEQLRALQAEREAARQQMEEYKRQLVQKDGTIAKQAEEVQRLQEHLARLEEEFGAIRADADQSTALVNCLNLLHGRNRALTQKIAKLEAQLEDAHTGREVQGLTRTAAEKQESVKNTETLFATVRKEIQDALDSISDKIEAGSIEESDDGNYFVDMANL